MTAMRNLDKTLEAFETAFGASPTVVASAPGRVNLIGEHVDYNGGLVFPAAIDRAMTMAAAPNGTNTIQMHSANFGLIWKCDIGKGLKPVDSPTWPNYFLGVYDEVLKRGGELQGLDIALYGDVPRGGGLSSSAAFEVCAAGLLRELLGVQITDRDIALLAQAAENGPFVGVPCGIMDQYISVFGQRDAALVVDCASLEHRVAPFDSGQASIVILNTMKPRALVEGEYARRRRECEAGLAAARQLLDDPSIPNLRALTPGQFDSIRDRLDPGVRRRVRHNVTENQRVLDFEAALSAGDFARAGEILVAGHRSLDEDFEVTCPELNELVEVALSVDGVYGSRMTGGGFGGCTVTLVRPDAAGVLLETAAARYRGPNGDPPESVVTAPADGLRVDRKD